MDLKAKEIKGKIMGEEEKPLEKENISEGPLEEQEILLPAIPEKTIDRCKKYIATYFTEKGKMPTIRMLSKKVNVSMKKISTIMGILLQEGFLIKKGTRFYLAIDQKDKLSTYNNLKKIKKIAKTNPGILVLKIVLFIIGCGATRMSIYHSMGFLEDFYTGKTPIAAAIIMIVFNIIAAQLIVFFWKRHSFSLCFIFSFLLLIGTIFSMGSTIIGMYNTRAGKIAVNTVAENKEERLLQENRLDHQNIKERKEQAKADIESAREKRDSLVRQLSTFDTPEKIENNKKIYYDLNWLRILADKDLKKLRQSYDIILSEEKEFLNTKIVTEKNTIKLPSDAFVWIGKTIGMEPNKLQFILSCYPAIFYDVIAPVAFSVVLFISADTRKLSTKKKRRKK